MIPPSHKLPEDAKQAITVLEKRLSAVEEEQVRMGVLLTLRNSTEHPGRSPFKN
jgi:hypothetical protein